MKNLKILRCCNLIGFRNQHLIAIADALPLLEELDIQSECYIQSEYNYNLWAAEFKSAKYMVTDAGIEVLSRKLRGSPDDSFTFENSMIYATSLCDLDLVASGDNDRLICSIATAGIPLEKFILHDDFGLSLHGLVTFLRACPSLTPLELCAIQFLNDNSMRDLCQYLPNLISITIYACQKLTATTFFILAKECPVLSEIKLQHTDLEVEDDFDMELERNYHIRSLELSYGRVNDEFLTKIGVVCPNL
ncbi:uncharacterized protein LOC114304552 [Camellia sinensis]|uniref:uncharacterized protein LOC114304552 n=1 Tax=Camellia sinensis TaxID=4442 RepID=UPI001035E3F8|nr:uncharacterized protein LOC114304552 [Camellia sinensis]